MLMVVVVIVTVGLASHWPGVTDNSGTTTYGLTALGREMSTQLMLLVPYHGEVLLIYF